MIDLLIALRTTNYDRHILEFVVVLPLRERATSL